MPTRPKKGAAITDEEAEEIVKGLKGQWIAMTVDIPLTYRFDAQTGALQVWASSNSMLDRAALPLQLDISSAATQALLRLLEAIRSNPGKDIEGSSTAPNAQ